MPPKRKQKPPEGSEERSSTIVISLHAAVAAAAKAICVNGDDIDGVRQSLGQDILRVTDASSRIAVLMSWLINLYLAWLPEEAFDVDPIDHALLTAAATLCNRLTDDAGAKQQPLLKQCFNECFLPLFPPDFPWPRADRAGNYNAALARDILVNFQVYQDKPLDDHVVGYLRAVFSVSKALARHSWIRAKQRHPHAKDFVPPTPRAQAPSCDSFLQHTACILAQRRQQSPILLRRDMLHAIQQRHDEIALAQAHDDAMDVETQNTANMRPGKLFGLFPIRKIRQAFAAIDTRNMVLWANTNRILSSVAPDNLIEAFFPRRAGWTPGRQIKTDGVRAALTYTRVVPVRTSGAGTTRGAKKKKTKKRKQDDGTAASVEHTEETNKVDLDRARRGIYKLEDVAPGSLSDTTDWEAFDPGLTYLFTGSDGTSLSRKQWRFEIGADVAVRKANARQVEIQSVLDETSRASLKSASVASIQLSIQTWLRGWTRQWKHYTARWWGHQRFRQYIREQRALARIANRVLGPEDPRTGERPRIAVFGDGVFPASVKGVPPAPVTKVRDYLGRFGRVVLVPEYNTSKTCSRCWRYMRRHASVHATMHCNQSSDADPRKGCSWTWDRDINAARNIADLFEAHMAGAPRPAVFCGPSHFIFG